MKSRNLFSFPPKFQGDNIIFDDGYNQKSFYISNNQALEEEKPKVDKLYYEYYKNLESNLSHKISHIKNKALARYVQSLISKTKILGIHDNDRFNCSNFYIHFTDLKNTTEWKNEFPSYGPLLELLSIEKIDHLPPPLQELYSIGVLHINFIPEIGFHHPKNIKKAKEVEFLGEYITSDTFRSRNFPINQLMSFYSQDGCWLMYDQNENVYCAGVECADFYKSSFKLDEVVSNIFSMAFNNIFTSIEAKAPKN